MTSSSRAWPSARAPTPARRSPTSRPCRSRWRGRGASSTRRAISCASRPSSFQRAAEHDEVPDLETKLRFRAHSAFAVNQAREAVETLWSCYGANGIYTRDPLQRPARRARHQPALLVQLRHRGRRLRPRGARRYLRQPDDVSVMRRPQIPKGRSGHDRRQRHDHDCRGEGRRVRRPFRQAGVVSPQGPGVSHVRPAPQDRQPGRVLRVRAIRRRGRDQAPQLDAPLPRVSPGHGAPRHGPRRQPLGRRLP